MMEKYSQLMKQDYQRLEKLRLEYKIKVGDIANNTHLAEITILRFRSRASKGNLKVVVRTYLNYVRVLVDLLVKNGYNPKVYEDGSGFVSSNEYVFRTLEEVKKGKRYLTLDEVIEYRKKCLNRSAMATAIGITDARSIRGYEKHWNETRDAITFGTLYRYAEVLDVDRIGFKL